MCTTEVRGSKESEETIDLNVVILPPDSISDQVEEWSRKVSEIAPTYFTLDRRNALLPHLSIYNAGYPQRNEEELLKSLSKIVASQKSTMGITFSGISHYNNTGFIFYDAVLPNPELQAFHERIVDCLNPLREGRIPETACSLILPEPQMASIREYGGLVKDVYPPHITLSRLQNPDDFEKVIDLLQVKTMTFMADTVALAPFAAHGTCPRPIQIFRLS